MFDYNTKICPICGSSIAWNAEVCPHCGYIFPKQSSKNGCLDTVCLISLAISSLLAISGPTFYLFAFGLNIFWLIVYQSLYNKAKNDYSVDESDVKKSLNAILIFFILNFGIVIIF